MHRATATHSPEVEYTLNYFAKGSKRFAPLFIIAALISMLFSMVPASAQQTTGVISGTVTDASSGAPIAGVKVTAASLGQTQSTTTDNRGFYALQNLNPDTYSVSFQKSGYSDISQPGITVQQALTYTLNQALGKSLKTIVSVNSRAAGNLVQPNITSDEYTVSGEQLDAASLGNEMHKTLYQYITVVPGITSSSFEAQPRIHGGAVTDEQYEFDGIPIRERMTGFFTTNLSNAGIANVQVFTGGLDASQAAAGLGVINTVVKSGTYPGFARVTYGAAVDGTRLTDLTAEFGGATPNHKFSWYGVIDKSDALNAYASGLTYPALAVEGDNGPGPVKTTDIIGNFHWRPDDKNDFQFLIQNGVGTFDFNYLMARSPGEPQPVIALPCPGYVANPNTATGASGGTAPNGANCPIGLYFAPANADGANNWYHYSGIGKIQWNHILSDHENLAFRVAENFNQYIFNQPVIDTNLAQYDNSPDFQTSSACTLNFPAPYTPGTPIETGNGTGTGAECQQQQNWFSTGYYGDRRSNMWLAQLDYTNNISSTTTFKAGVGDEYDDNLWNTYYSFYMNSDGSWPGLNSASSYPSHVANAYFDLSSRVGTVRLDPGVMFQRMYYDYPAYGGKPGGPISEDIINPTFSATWTMNTKNVLRASFTNSNSFVGTGYVYRQGSSVYAPGNATDGGIFNAAPTIIHSMDLMWEHQFDSNTSLKVGPYFNKASDIFEISRPVLSVDPNGIVHYGPARAYNSGFRQAFGAELGLNHVNKNPIGVSYFWAVTYDNFWTNSTQSLTGSYGGSSSGSSVLSAFPPIRNTGDPLISTNLTVEAHINNVRIIPQIYYQGPSFYQTGSCANSLGNPSTCVSSGNFRYLLPEKTSTGWWWTNLAGAIDVGPHKGITLGVQVSNLMNQLHDTTPCYATQLQDTPGLYPGCGPFWPTSPQSGLPSHLANGQGVYVYQNYSQTPRQIQLWASFKPW